MHSALRNLPKEREDARRARVGLPPRMPQDYSGRDLTGELLNAGSLALSPVPFVGDALGLGADYRMYQTKPEERTMGNYAMTLAGLLPLVPSASATKTAVRSAEAIKEGAKRGVDMSQEGKNIMSAGIEVRSPSDNIADVRNANFQYPKTIGNQTVNIDSITGGVRLDEKELIRINNLARQISSPEGYISRIIVDQNNNVIEGQHRLEALRQLGIKDVPVFKIEEMADSLPTDKMKDAIRSIGNIHSDHVNQLVQQAAENISEYGLIGARDFDYGNFQKYYNAALDSSSLNFSEADRAQRALDLGHSTQDFYHATKADVTEFEPDKLGLTFLGTSPKFANDWLDVIRNRRRDGTYQRELDDIANLENRIDPSGTGYTKSNFYTDKNKLKDEYDFTESNIIPLRTNVQNTFDPSQNDDLLKEYLATYKPYPAYNYSPEEILPSFQEGNYHQYETPEMVDFLKNKGFDSMWLREGLYKDKDEPFSTLAVFDPANIRSKFAKFDKGQRLSRNISAGVAGTALGLSALRNINKDSEQMP